MAISFKGAHVLSGARWRHGSGLVITAVVVVVAALFLVVILDSLLIAVGNAPTYVKGLAAWHRGELSWQEYLVVVQLGNAIFWFVALYCGFFLLPFIATLPVSAPLIVLWREPPVFLFLRPFNRRPLTHGLARLVRKDIGRFGHTYTLADADLHVPWYVRVPALLGQLALLSFRVRRIRRDAQLGRLDRAIARTWLRNINWCLSWSKVFAVATDDDHWQRVVERLLQRSTAVFIDLTELRPNILWELALIRRLGLERRAIFLLQRDASAHDLDVIRIELGDLPDNALHCYDHHGILDRISLRSAIAHQIAYAREHRTITDPSRFAQVSSLFVVTLFVLGCLPLLAVIFIPALQERMLRNNPLAQCLLVYAGGTWIFLWASAYWNRLMVFLAVVQTLLLFGLMRL